MRAFNVIIGYYFQTILLCKGFSKCYFSVFKPFLQVRPILNEKKKNKILQCELISQNIYQSEIKRVCIIYLYCGGYINCFFYEYTYLVVVSFTF